MDNRYGHQPNGVRNTPTVNGDHSPLVSGDVTGDYPPLVNGDHPPLVNGNHSLLINGDYEDLNGIGFHLSGFPAVEDGFPAVDFDQDAVILTMQGALQVGDGKGEVLPDLCPADQTGAVPVALAGGDDDDDHVFDVGVGEINPNPPLMSGAAYPADQTGAVPLAEGGDDDDRVFEVGVGEINPNPPLIPGAVPLPPALRAGDPLVPPQHGLDNHNVGPLDLNNNINININLNVHGGGIVPVEVSSGLPNVVESSPHAQAIAIFTSAELTLLSSFQLVRPHMPLLQQQPAHARVWALQDELRGWARYAHARVVDGLPTVADDRLQHAANVVLEASEHMLQAIPLSGPIQVAPAVEAFLEALMVWPNLSLP